MHLSIRTDPLGVFLSLIGKNGQIAGGPLIECALVFLKIYPLQILLIIPYIKMGELLFRTQHVPLDFSSLKIQIQNAPKDFIMEKGSLLLQGVVAWACLAPFVIGLLYGIFLPLFKKMKILRKA